MVDTASSSQLISQGNACLTECLALAQSQVVDEEQLHHIHQLLLSACESTNRSTAISELLYPVYWRIILSTCLFESTCARTRTEFARTICLYNQLTIPFPQLQRAWFNAENGLAEYLTPLPSVLKVVSMSTVLHTISCFIASPTKSSAADQISLSHEDLALYFQQYFQHFPSIPLEFLHFESIEQQLLPDITAFSNKVQPYLDIMSSTCDSLHVGGTQDTLSLFSKNRPRLIAIISQFATYSPWTSITTQQSAELLLQNICSLPQLLNTSTSDTAAHQVTQIIDDSFPKV